ncbi:MAG: hypothetical protein MZV65_51640 [Chromatiales bacterium]|nr:hypothetical protein [Chromatiales bacterium]
MELEWFALSGAKRPLWDVSAFYSCHKNEIWISPSINQVLKGNAPKDFDDEALAVLLRIGHPIANDTPFRYIQALPPHSILTWESGRLQIVSQERAIRRGPIFQLSFDEAVDQFIELLIAQFKSVFR